MSTAFERTAAIATEGGGGLECIECSELLYEIYDIDSLF